MSFAVSHSETIGRLLSTRKHNCPHIQAQIIILQQAGFKHRLIHKVFPFIHLPNLMIELFLACLERGLISKISG